MPVHKSYGWNSCVDLKLAEPPVAAGVPSASNSFMAVPVASTLMPRQVVLMTPRNLICEADVVLGGQVVLGICRIASGLDIVVIIAWGLHV